MGECPNIECHKKVEGHHKSLFGENGLGGIAGCMKKFITKRTLWISLMVIGIPLFITGIKVWSQQSVSPHVFTTKVETSIIGNKVIRLEEQYIGIRRSQERMENKLEKIESDRSRDVNMILNEIRRIERGGNDYTPAP